MAETMMVHFIAKRMHHRTFYAWVGRTTLNEEKRGSDLFWSDRAPSEYKSISLQGQNPVYTKYTRAAWQRNGKHEELPLI